MFLKILKEQKPWNRKSSLYIFWFYSARKIRINLLSLALFIAIIQQVQTIFSDLNKKLEPSQCREMAQDQVTIKQQSANI